MRMCANCRADLTAAREDGVSSIYSPTRQYMLCGPCWEEEEALIDREGTNDLPERLARYERNANDVPGGDHVRAAVHRDVDC